MSSIFRSEFDIKSMISILREKIPRIEWRMGDSDYDNFYVLSRTTDGIKIKITEEDGSERYCLGIYSYGTSHIGLMRKLVISAILRRRVMKAIAAKKCFL